LAETRKMPQDTRDNNLANLPHGKIDAVITSPPYADSKKQPEKINLEHEVSSMETDTRADTKNRHTPGRTRAIESMLSGYGKNERNVGNLPLGEVDAIVTSPPYEGSLEGTSRHTKGGIASRDPALAQTGTYATQLSFGVPVGYSPDKNNIGNLKSKDEEYEQLEKNVDVVES